jgi:hypothetical protein
MDRKANHSCGACGVNRLRNTRKIFGRSLAQRKRRAHVLSESLLIPRVNSGKDFLGGSLPRFPSLWHRLCLELILYLLLLVFRVSGVLIATLYPLVFPETS